MNPARKRILVVRLGSMGDIIHALPVSAALKETFPDWEIDWLVERRWRDLLIENPQLSDVIEVDTLLWRTQPLSGSVWTAARNALAQLRERCYDYALDLQGAIKSAVFCGLSGAKEIIGFDRPWLKEPACATLYNRTVRVNAVHIVEANLALAAALGAEVSNVRFALPEGDATSLPSIPSEGFAVLNPGAGWRSKCWPPDHYAAVADALLEEFSMQTVLNCGPGEEVLAKEVRDRCRIASPVTYMGDLGGLIALLRRTRLMVGPDTGPIHLAAALGVATVGLFGPTDPVRNGPYGKLHRSLRAEGAATSYRHTSEEASVMRSIHPEQVLEAVRELLQEQSPVRTGRHGC
ncbi:MAG: lipopolysaccharide heptosyltransferase I [Acidobacteria bacterium]|nr:lipopolysaccharide heptosyltransferase I [Acidobacteriota bacterium]